MLGSAVAEGGLGEDSPEEALAVAEGVLVAMRASPVAYPEEEVSYGSHLKLIYLVILPSPYLGDREIRRLWHVYGRGNEGRAFSCFECFCT